ncbi:MAG: hypothetical protein AAGA20_14160 [Planctomycetota bacterium]
MNSRVLLTLLGGCLCASGLAQELPTFTYRLQTGDIGALGGPISTPRVPAPNRAGVVYQTASDINSGRFFTAEGQRPFLIEGDPVPGQAREVFTPPSVMCATPGGALWSIVGYTDPLLPSGARGLNRGGRLVVIPGQICTAPGVPQGSRYTGIATIAGAFDRVCYVVVGLDQVGPTEVLLEITTDDTGAIVSERVVAMPGMVLPGLSGGLNRVIGGSLHESGASCLIVVDGGGTVAVLNGT